MSDSEPQTDLSPETVQVLAEWLRRQDGTRPSAGEAPAIPELVRYLCGALPPHEAAALDTCLIATKTALRRLREVRMDLLRLEAMPWQAVAEAAQGDDQTAAVASAWLTLTSEQMQAAERARDQWLATGWQALRDQVEAGVGGALATWNAFLAFGAQWGRELHAPGRFALQRGAETSEEAILPGVAAPVLVEAEIDPGDTLHVTLRVGAQPDAPDVALNGRSVVLELRNDAEAWPLSTALLTDGYAEWRIPGFGGATGMPVGEIPTDSLQFAFTEAAAIPTSSSPIRLLAEITDREGSSSSGSLAPIIFLEEPHWSGGKFVVRVELPAETRYWLDARYELRLDVAVSGAHWQHLGAWTLAEGGDAPHTLQASCPGSLDVILPSVTLIRAQLRPPE